MDQQIQFIVGGQRFTISEKVLRNGPSSRLTTIISKETASCSQKGVIVDRPADIFAAILTLYQTGSLHIPMTSCPGAFLDELEFWEISPDCISSCCFNRLESFIQRQDLLESFKQGQRNTLNKSENTKGTFQKIRSKLWEIVDYQKPTIIGKAYFALALLMVMMSIFTLAYSTDASFRREMTNCERLEYMLVHEMEGQELVAEKIRDFCKNNDLPTDPLEKLKSTDFTNNATLMTVLGSVKDDKFIDVLFTFVFKNPSIPEPMIELSSFRQDSRLNINISKWHNITGLENVTDEIDLQNQRVLRLPSVVRMEKSTKLLKVPNLKVKIHILVVLEMVVLGFFTVDIIVRSISCPHIGRYFVSIVNLADAVALTCSYVDLIVNYVDESEKYKENWIDFLNYAQLLRTLRIFRIIRYVRAGRVLAYSAWNNLNDLAILILFIISGMCVFASIIFIIDDSIESIPMGWYWAVITMTTVGYGDVYPKTGLGRLLSCFCAVCGIVLLAIMVPIFTGNFQVLYEQADSKNAVENYLRNRKTTAKIKMSLKESCSIHHRLENTSPNRDV